MMQEITKSRKLDHVAYDVRGPVVDAAAEMEGPPGRRSSS